MEKIRRTERMSAMMKILSDAPNRIHTLSQFCELFSAAKSTMSEDIDTLKKVVELFELGELETVTGAAGGVRYRAKVQRKTARAWISNLCQELSGTSRVLPGGDRHEAALRFRAFAAQRTEDTVNDSLYRLSCPTLELDASLPLQALTSEVTNRWLAS